ncbi:MAG: thioredoxin family protein [Bacteroidetes bacterium]|nr:MAG: thioredoxin family protein [Bacteroidota bacterium]
MNVRSLFLTLLTLSLFSFLTAQNPVKWTYQSKDAGNGEMDLIFTATIEDGWTTYSQFLESDEGPVATSFTFLEGPHFALKGKAEEGGEKFTKYDNVFGMKLTKFKHKAIFTQRVKVNDFNTPVTGYLTYMVCNDEMCLPPKDVDFEFKLTPPASSTTPPGEAETPKSDGNTNIAPEGMPDGNGGDTGAAEPAGEQTPESTAGTQETVPGDPRQTPNDPKFQGFFDAKREINSAKFINSCSTPEEKSTSLWWVLIAGFLGGLVALLTPCVFPMIPLTVSFFTKRSRDRATGMRNALWYSSSIVLIYVSIGIVLTSVFGPTILNQMSTDMYFNLLFFVVFVVFALSFFGLFEITLPSSWVNKSDKMADKGGMLGIFFMAFTLALVSFSCTGPIVGTLLVETAKGNAGDALFGVVPTRPLVGMTGFGLALALPFGLFAMFPGWLQSLPKSGNWMDNIKVTLGFVELALAFKFLSTADMVRHWGVLKFEPFIALWFICALLLGLYQFGLLPKLKGAEGRPGPVRAIFGALALIFAGYLGDGLMNYKSLSLLSGIAPPVHYNFFQPMNCPHGLECYKDFDEALKVAQDENKPLFVDFTGYGCVNCRKMEETVWNKQEILEHLRDNYVVVSLYVDDQARLFPDDKFKYLLDPHTGEKMRTVGDKWSSFQINNFHRNSQPWYVLMHNDGKTLLNEPRGYTPEVDEYKAFLDCGFDAFAQMKPRDTDKTLIGAKQ